jgi:hypothetical protein
MPRYFFHVRNGNDFPDHDGVELAGPAEARRMAVQALGELLRDSALANSEVFDSEMIVTDERQSRLFALALVQS